MGGTEGVSKSAAPFPLSRFSKLKKHTWILTSNETHQTHRRRQGHRLPNGAQRAHRRQTARVDAGEVGMGPRLGPGERLLLS